MLNTKTVRIVGSYHTSHIHNFHWMWRLFTKLNQLWRVRVICFIPCQQLILYHCKADGPVDNCHMLRQNLNQGHPILIVLGTSI